MLQNVRFWSSRVTRMCILVFTSSFFMLSFGNTLAQPIAVPECAATQVVRIHETGPGVELEAGLLNENQVITGISMNIRGDNFTAVRLQTGSIEADGNLREGSYILAPNSVAERGELYFSLPDNFVMVGLGLRAAGDNLTTAKVYARQYNPRTRSFGGLHTFRTGSAPENGLEVDFPYFGYPNPTSLTENWILSGVGLTASDSNVSQMQLRFCLLQFNPPAEPSESPLVRCDDNYRTVVLSDERGITDERDVAVEMHARLPLDDQVVTGIIMNIRGDDFTTIGLEYRTIGFRGTLNEARELVYAPNAEDRDGEINFRLPDGFVMVGLGLRAAGDNLTTAKIYAREYDPASGELGRLHEFSAGSQPNNGLEVDYQYFGFPNRTSLNVNWILTGVGAVATDSNVRILKLEFCGLGPDT